VAAVGVCEKADKFRQRSPKDRNLKPERPRGESRCGYEVFVEGDREPCISEKPDPKFSEKYGNSRPVSKGRRVEAEAVGRPPPPR